MQILQYLQLIFTISKRCLPFDYDDQTPAYFSINDCQKGRLHSKFQNASLDMHVKTLCVNPAKFQTLKTCVCNLGNITCSILQV
jgi:hypothetical protein